jgi:hypothetical protein
MQRSAGGTGTWITSWRGESKPLRMPPPLNQLPWDIAQDQFGVEGTDFIGHMGIVLLRAAQDPFEAYLTDSARATDTVQLELAQDQIRPVRESVRVGNNRS